MAERIDFGKILVTLEGEWDSTRGYDKYCEVSSDGSSYVSKKAVPSGTPITNTEYWQKRAAKGADGTDGTDGVDGSDGADAYQPFKGWFASSAALSAAYPAPQVGDYAYVKGAAESDPVAVYECNTAGTWVASQREFNPANNQSFGSGEELNTVRIVDGLDSESATDVLSAKQGKVLDKKIEKIAGGEIGSAYPLMKILQDGSVATAVSATNRTLIVDVTDYVGRQVKVSGILYAKSGNNVYCWWAFHDSNGNVLGKSASSTSTHQTFSDIKITIPNGAKYLYVQGSSTTLPTAQVYPFIRETIDEHTQDIAQLEDEVIIKRDNIVDTPDSIIYRIISSTTETWSNNDIPGGAFYVFNVKAGDKYQIQTNTENGTHVHLLISLDTTVAPQHMEGTERIIIPKGEEAIVDVPQDGYMLVAREFYADGNGDYLPTAVNKVESVKDVIIDHEERFENIEEGSYSQIKYSILSLKKITSDGLVLDASTTTNRTLKADITDYIGKTLKLDGYLYKLANGNNYCWWVFQDAEGNVIEKSETSTPEGTRYSNVSVVVPNGAVTLYVQGVSSFMPNAKAMAGVILDKLIDEGFADNTEKTIRTFALDYPWLSGNTGRILTATNSTNKFCKHTFEYIKIHNSIKIKNLGGITQNVSVYFYDKDLTFISYTSYPASEGLNELVVTDIPSGAVWFRVNFYVSNNDVATTVGYSRFEVDIESEWGYGVETCKAPYVEYQPFIYGVKSNVPIKIAEHSYTTKTVFGYDEGLIHLPPTYSPNGKPTPLIFLIHGDAERYTLGESTFSGHMKMQQCWSDAGFAQVDLDLIPSWLGNTGLSSSGGVGSDLDCLCAAWKWIINHYNIDTEGFYLIGRSRGGQAVLEILAKGGATKLPIVASISMAGANSMMRYSLISNKARSEAQWQMWCDSRGLPTDGRPSWSSSPFYNTAKPFMTDPDIYNFVSSNFDLWVNKELTGWGLITKNTDNITPREYFDTFMYPYVQNSTVTTAIEEFFLRMKNTMEAKSPIPLRLDWCVGDRTQKKEPFVSTPHSYSSVFSEILISTPASNVEYRRWPGVDAENPYGETDPHYAENMIFYDGDLVLPNGNVTHNPSKVTMEWLIWCMGKDPRYNGIEYTLPWQ